MSGRKMTIEEIDRKYHKERNLLLTEPDLDSDSWEEDAPFFLEGCVYIPYESLCIGPLTQKIKGLLAEAKGNGIPNVFANGNEIIDPAMRLAYHDEETGQWEQLIYRCNKPKRTRKIQVGDTRRYKLEVTNRDAICRMILINGYLFYNGRRYTDNVSRMPKDEEWGILYTVREE